MWQRDKVEGKAFLFNHEFAADNNIQFVEDDELRDCELTDGDNESRPENFHFIIQPGRTVGDFLRAWHAIGAAGCFAGKTSDDSGEIDSRAHNLFIHSAPFLKPAEQGFAGGVRKRSLEHGLAHARRLANDHDFADDSAARYRRWNNARTATALPQSRDVFTQT